MSESIEAKELREAGERLAAAKVKYAEAEAKRLQVVSEQIAQHRAEEERKQWEQAEISRQVAEKWAKQRQEEENARILAERERQNEQRLLEAQFNRLEEEKRQRELREKELLRLDNLAHEAELEAQRVAEEAARPQKIRVVYSPRARGTEQGSDEMNPALRNLIFGRPAENNQQTQVLTEQTEALPVDSVEAQRLKAIYGDAAYEEAHRFTLESQLNKLSETENIEARLRLTSAVRKQ